MQKRILWYKIALMVDLVDMSFNIDINYFV